MGLDTVVRFCIDHDELHTALAVLWREGGRVGSEAVREGLGVEGLVSALDAGLVRLLELRQRLRGGAE